MAKLHNGGATFTNIVGPKQGPLIRLDADDAGDMIQVTVVDLTRTDVTGQIWLQTATRMPVTRWQFAMQLAPSFYTRYRTQLLSQKMLHLPMLW